MPLYQWSSRFMLQNEISEIGAQTSSAARELFRHARIHVRARLCLSVGGLVNAMLAAFLCGAAQMTRRADHDMR
jgi:hypothetical protein